MSRYYQCARCRGLARLSEKSRFVIPGGYAAVAFPFVWFSPSHWGVWAAGCLFALLTVAEVVATCFIARFEPLDVEDRR